MRLSIGLSALLVIVLGCLCISPIRSYQNEDAAPNQQQQQATSTANQEGPYPESPIEMLPTPVPEEIAANAQSPASQSGDGSSSSSAAAYDSSVESEGESASPDMTEDEASAIAAEDSATYEKREENSRPFGEPKQPNSAGADQEIRQREQQQQQQGQGRELSQPVNAPMSSSSDATYGQDTNPPTLESEARSASDSNASASLKSGSRPKSVQDQQQENKQPTDSSARGLGGLMGLIKPQVHISQQHLPPDQMGGLGQQQLNVGQFQQQQQQVQLIQPQQQLEAYQQQQQQQQQESRPQLTDVPKEHLPTIIESNHQVNKQQQQQQQQQSSVQQTQQQQQSQQPQQQTQTEQQSQPGGGIARMLPSEGLTLPSAGNSTSSTGLGPSTGRTFGDGWTNCQGASSGKYGTCKNDVNCKKDKGVPDGSCMSGLGVCCVMALTCNDKSMENNTFFANPDFPDPSWEARLCEVEIKKKHKKISQVMIEFEEFELAPPNADGECTTDVFQVNLNSGRPSPYSLLRICGQNTGQHLYLDVSQIDEPLVLSLATSGGGFPRRWSIRIVQMDEKNHLLAPPGCLQYYTDTLGHFRSFNLGRNLKNLYYAICFRIDNGYSGIRFTSNFFGMNGPQCVVRKKPIGYVHGSARPMYNQTYEGYPHSLVIPPKQHIVHHQPQQMIPSPPPQQPHYMVHPYSSQVSMQYQPGQQRLLKRTPTAAGTYLPANASARTFHDMSFGMWGGKDTKMDNKKHHGLEHEHEHHHQQQHYSSPSYAPGYPPTYAPQQPVYGTNYSSPPPAYGQPPVQYGAPEYGSLPPHHLPHHQKQMHHYQQQPYPSTYEAYEHQGKKDDKFGWKDDRKDDKWGWKSDKKDDKFGWKEEKKDDKWDWKMDKWSWKGEKKDDKYGHEYKSKYEHYPQQHQQGGYGYQQQPSYGQGYGPPPQHYGKGYDKEYDQGYGPEYHHKEKDKFGKEHKHEKGHMDKEGKKDEKIWWFWQKKDDKKDKKEKEKFFTHHEALFPMMHIPEMPHCEPRFCGQNDVITFPPSGDSISEMCGNRFNRGRGPKIISGSPLVVYVSNRGHNRGAGFDMNYEQVFYVPNPY